MTALNLHSFVPSTQNEGHLIARAIKEGMAPFRVKQVDLYWDFDIDYNEYRVLGEAEVSPGYIVAHTERINAWHLADAPEREFLRVADNMRKAFRNREEYPIQSNIKLGEN